MSNSPSRDGTSASTSTSTVQSVDRAVTILEILAREGEAGVTDLAGELGVHKSTAFRLVCALESRGLVAQDAQRGKYRLGMGILRLAGATTARLDVVQESRPVTQALAREIGETINITVPAGDEVLYLDQVAGPSVLQVKDWVGQRLPAHATSNGKVLLAYLGEPELTERLAARRERFTDRTITARRDLEKELAVVRERGYATAIDEMEFGLTAIAAPIRNAERRVIASLSASGPSFRIPADRIPLIAESVCRAADTISHRLGYLS